MQFAQSKCDRVDVLINKAGVMPLSTLDRLKVEEWDRTIDINIKGVLYGIAAALPVMKAQKAGQIINLSSMATRCISDCGCLLRYQVRGWRDFRRIETRSWRRYSGDCDFSWHNGIGVSR